MAAFEGQWSGFMKRMTPLARSNSMSTPLVTFCPSRPATPEPTALVTMNSMWWNGRPPSVNVSTVVTSAV